MYFFSDTFWVTKIAESFCGSSCMQLFVSEKCFVKVYGIRLEKESLQGIKLSCREVEVPTSFIVDPSVSQTKNEVWAFFSRIAKLCRYWKNRLNMKIELNYILVSWKRASVRTLEEKIHCCYLVLCWLATSPNIEANSKEYFRTARHIYLSSLYNFRLELCLFIYQKCLNLPTHPLLHVLLVLWIVLLWCCNQGMT